MPGQITFEQPLNEKCRTLLRLSHLFEQFDNHVPHADLWHARAALTALLDIASVLSRADIKSDLLKDMERYRAYMTKLANTPGVDADRLQTVLQNLQHSARAIQSVQGQLGNELRKSDFLNSVLQRSSIPGGDFDFDLPQLHYWLHQDESERQLQFDDWRSSIGPVHEAVELLLGLIRHSTRPEPAVAELGFYQQSLASGSGTQMVQVILNSDLPMYAEISGGKHRFSIRFMETQDWEHPVQTEQDVHFQLNVCSI